MIIQWMHVQVKYDAQINMHSSQQQQKQNCSDQ